MARRPTAGDAEILREAKARFERCVTWETAWRDRALFDTKFANGDAANGWQWFSGGQKIDRGDRPTLTYNQVRIHNLLVVNDARQNKAQIKVTPTGGRATYEAAQVFSGIIRSIEYRSKAVDAYSTAIYHQVESGIGYVRVETDYVDEQSFDLDLWIRRVPDPRAVYMDPDCKTYDKSDANFAFVFDDCPRDRYEEEYGTADNTAPVTLDHSDGWNDKNHVRIAEYWRRNVANAKLHQLRDGTVVRDEDIEAAPEEIQDQIRSMIEKTREVAEPEIEWFKLAGDKIIDRREWPGRYIPIVPFIGEETVIDNEMDRKGHTRSQIDAQRIYNYWASAAVEQVALQTKTPYVSSVRAIMGREDQWRTANTQNWSTLVYNDMDDEGRPVERPQREPPPQMAQAYIQGMTIAREDLRAVTGQYQAEQGMPSNERSGVAINQRQRQSEQITYHYVDNQAKAIRQVGRILIDLIPRVYDTRRVVMTLAEDGDENRVMVAPDSPEAHQFVGPGPDGQPQALSPGDAQKMQEDPQAPDPSVIFNPSVGAYDVEADVGPAYGTQRQEAANAFSQIMAQNPAAFQVVGDFWAQNSDFPGADELADRLKRGLPPQYRAGPDPQVQAISQEAQQMQQQASQLLQKADNEIASLKAQIVHQQELLKDKSQDLAIKAHSVAIDDYNAESGRLKAVGQIDPMALQLVVRQMVSDMLATELHPMLQQHAANESELQATMAPPAPNGGGNGSAPPAVSTGAPTGP